MPIKKVRKPTAAKVIKPISMPTSEGVIEQGYRKQLKFNNKKRPVSVYVPDYPANVNAGDLTK